MPQEQMANQYNIPKDAGGSSALFVTHAMTTHCLTKISGSE